MLPQIRLCFQCVLLFNFLISAYHSARNNGLAIRKRPRVGDLRLRGGRTAEEGNVEIFYAGQWGAVCDDDWDIADAAVACMQMGFERGALGVSTDSAFGRFTDRVWLDNVRCTGREKRLSLCSHDGWGLHDCNGMEAAGVICKPKLLPVADDSKSTNPEKSQSNLITISETFPEKHLSLQLKNGRTPNEGRVEVVSPLRGVICADNWSLKEAVVVCRHLGLGYGQQAVQGDHFRSAKDSKLPFLLSGVVCTGDEPNLTFCKAQRLPSKCHETLAASVVCSQELPDLQLDLELVRDSVYLHDHSLHFLQCAMEENCLASSAARLMSEPAWYYKIRRLLRFSTKVHNIGDADFLPNVAKSQWQWHQCHMHYHSMEIFSHYDIIDPKTMRHVAEGHKASFCLEDTDCGEEVKKRYQCANYGDQGISPGCWDTYLHDIDCQWIDISDLGPGSYIFKVSVNPEYKVAEKNFSNNAVLCDLYYNRIQAIVSNCVYATP